MQVILSAIRSVLDWFLSLFNALGTWIVTLITTVWNWIMSFFLTVVNWTLEIAHRLLTWLLELIAAVAVGAVKLFVAFLDALISLLPQMPSEPPGWFSAGVGAFSVADQIMPIHEALQLASVWASIYTAMAIWRAITFIRGGR